MRIFHESLVGDVSTFKLLLAHNLDKKILKNF